MQRLIKLALGVGVWGYVRANRIAFLHRAAPLTEREAAYLSGFFTTEEIAPIRVLERSDAGLFNWMAAATTYGPDLIIVRRNHRSLRLLKHELVHVRQYRQFGLWGFCSRYAAQYVDGGYRYASITFERQAFQFEGEEATGQVWSAT